MRRVLGVLALGSLVFGACAPETRGEGVGPLATPEFKEYWFAGLAELSRYRLEQARYGEVHEGDAVLIFVTEDFLPDKQVKADSPDRERTGARPVLKLNFTRNFVTGLYPYSMMTSVFTPLDLATHPRTLKTSTSVQEWCGHTWLQLNLRDGRYRVQGNSYFESEADRAFALPVAWLEDELWTRIRLAPDSLPLGDVRMIPGGQQSRLRHRELAVETARATLERTNDGVSIYRLDYPATGRTLAIRFTAAFPHEVLGWEERYSDFGKPLTTRAERTHVLRTDYWTRHGNADRALRGELGLD